jgi:hypothetical protein
LWSGTGQHIISPKRMFGQTTGIRLSGNSLLIAPLWVLLAWFFIADTGSCLGPNGAETPTLESYLKQLGYAGLKFEHTDHTQPFIDSTLSNGRKPRLLVDTGWDMSSLNPKSARGLKTVAELGGHVEDSVLGTITDNDIALIDKLILGGVAQFSNQPVLVRELKMDYIATPWDGVLGLDFLTRNYGLIDCWTHRLYVRAGKLTDQQAEVMDQTLRLSGFTEAPLNSSGPLNADAEINGHPVRLLVDTGAPYHILDNSQIKALGLNLVHYSRPSTGSYIERDAATTLVGTGKIGAHTANVSKLDTFELGGRTWKNLYFAVTDLGQWGAAAPGSRDEATKGFLSQEFLGRQGALIDVGRRKLWLRATKPSTQPH